MKTQLSKPARGYARYTDEYKEQALQLWRASGRSAAKVAPSAALLIEASQKRLRNGGTGARKQNSIELAPQVMGSNGNNIVDTVCLAW
jgi:hypothetical protein